MQTFFQHSPECHAVLVEDGDSFRFQEVNPATLRLYGMARDEVVGRTTHEVLGPEAGAEVTRNLAAVPPHRRPLPLRADARRRDDRSRGDARCRAAMQGAARRRQRARRDANGAASRSSCARRRRWRRWASSPAASRTTSTTC